jgi:hypothetical protein
MIIDRFLRNQDNSLEWRSSYVLVSIRILLSIIARTCARLRCGPRLMGDAIQAVKCHGDSIGLRKLRLLLARRRTNRLKSWKLILGSFDI